MNGFDVLNKSIIKNGVVFVIVDITPVIKIVDYVMFGIITKRPVGKVLGIIFNKIFVEDVKRFLKGLLIFVCERTGIFTSFFIGISELS